MSLRETIQKKIDAFLLRKAKEQVREKISSFFRPPRMGAEEERKPYVPPEEGGFDYPLVALSEHFLLSGATAFIELLDNLLQEETAVEKTAKK